MNVYYEIRIYFPVIWNIFPGNYLNLTKPIRLQDVLTGPMLHLFGIEF